MTTIKFFLQFHYGRRRPTVEVWLNGQRLAQRLLWASPYSQCQECQILAYDADLQSVNRLQLIMRDKTDQDLVLDQDDIIDHYVEIMDIEIASIRLEHLLYGAGTFRHSMPEAWVNDMSARGIHIDPIYAGATQLRLNGIWSMDFTTPFWQWCAERS
jgi:hypothetical protein